MEKSVYLLAVVMLACGCIDGSAPGSKAGPSYGATELGTTSTTLPVECTLNEDCIPEEPLVGVQYVCEDGVCRTRALGNPASMKCVEDGGVVKIINEAAGERGVCLFQDGSVCDEWAYFRGECLQGECMKKCSAVGSRSEGWYDCNDRLLYWDDCADEMDVFLECTGFSIGGACTLEYNPVCAQIQTDEGLEWRTYGNACTACSSTEKVLGYKTGECPETGFAVKIT